MQIRILTPTSGPSHKHLERGQDGAVERPREACDRASTGPFQGEAQPVVLVLKTGTTLCCDDAYILHLPINGCINLGFEFRSLEHLLRYRFLKLDAKGSTAAATQIEPLA